MKFKPTGQLRTEQIRHLGVNVNSPYGGRMNQIIIRKSHIKLKHIKGEFPGGPPVRTPLPLKRALVESLMGEIRYHKPLQLGQKRNIGKN